MIWLCGKECHPSRGKAEAALRSLEKRGLTRPENGELRTFYCKRCEAWHTGHHQPYRAPDHTPLDTL